MQTIQLAQLQKTIGVHKMVINSTGFTYYKDDNEFVAEASDIDFRLERIFPDSADAGFKMVSARTGKELTFYLDHEEKSNEGELQAWHFKAYTRDSALKNITAIVFND